MPKPARRNGTKIWEAMENEVSGRNPLADLVNLQVKPLSFLPWKHSSNCNWVTTMVKHCYPMLSRANAGRSGHHTDPPGSSLRSQKKCFSSNYSNDPNCFSFFSSWEHVQRVAARVSSKIDSAGLSPGGSKLDGHYFSVLYPGGN